MQNKSILLISPFYSGIGGVETSLQTLNKLLTRRGWKVDVCSLKPLPKGLYEKIETKPFLGFIYLILPLLFKSLKFIGRKYKCIHGAGMAGGFVAMCVSKLCNIPYVVSTHAIYKGIRGFTWIEKLVLKKAKKVLCLGKDSRDEIWGYANIGTNNLIIYRALIDWERFRPIEGLERFYWKDTLVENKPLFIARPIPKKGWDIVTEIPNVQMFCDIPNFCLPAFYNISSVTITAAQYEECFSRTILESLFCDTPVIASNKDIARFIIPPDVVTFVEPTVEALTKAIKEFKRKPKGFYRDYAMREFGENNIEVFENAYRK